jgi:hypothetical protein
MPDLTAQSRSRWGRTLGIALIVFSCLAYGVLLSLPLLSLAGRVKLALAPVLVVLGEVAFWIGGVLLGKELVMRFRSFLNPCRWIGKLRRQTVNAQNHEIWSDVLMKRLAIGLTLFTFLGVAAYWLAVFAGWFPVSELVPGYRNWFLSFPLADGWIAVVSLLAFIFLLRGDKRAALCGLLAGSSLIFLGLYALLYGVNTGLLFNLTTDEVIEIAIKVYCLSVGSFFIGYFWHLAKETPGV